MGKKKKILISGCSGFLGTWLTDTLYGIGEIDGESVELYGFTEVPGFVSSQLAVEQVDITNREAVFAWVEKVRPDLVYHLAAIANVGYSWEHQKLTYEVNFIGTSNIMEALCQSAPSARLVLMSSAELYGHCAGDVCDEKTPLAPPKNPYALSKRAMEMLASIYLEGKNLDIVTVRSFNFTGPGQSPQFAASSFARQIAEIELGKREPVIRVGNLSAVRDMSDVRDVARYLVVIARLAAAGSIYNICSGSAYSIQELLDILLGMARCPIRVEVDSDRIRPTDIPVLMGNSRRLKEYFGLQPIFTIKQTLSDLLDDWRKKVKVI